MIPIAHVGGIPIEETLGSFGPALLVGLGVASAKLRARLRRVRSRRFTTATATSNWSQTRSTTSQTRAPT